MSAKERRKKKEKETLSTKKMKRKERVFKLSLSLTERPSLAFYDASSFLIDGFIEMVALSLSLSK